MINYKDLLKVGDYVTAVSDCHMVDTYELFAVRNNKYKVIELVETTEWEQERFVIRDEVGDRHSFLYTYLDPNHENYLYDVVRISRINKINSLMDN